LNEVATNESWAVRDVRVYIGNFVTRANQQKQEQKVIGAEFTHKHLSNKDFEGWTAVNKYGGPFTDCAGTTICGGYGVFGKGSSLNKVYKDLDNHKYVRISVKVFFLDTWDSEWFYINVDGKKVY